MDSLGQTMVDWQLILSFVVVIIHIVRQFGEKIVPFWQQA